MQITLFFVRYVSKILQYYKIFSILAIVTPHSFQRCLQIFLMSFQTKSHLKLAVISENASILSKVHFR